MLDDGNCGIGDSISRRKNLLVWAARGREEAARDVPYLRTMECLICFFGGVVCWRDFKAQSNGVVCHIFCLLFDGGEKYRITSESLRFQFFIHSNKTFFFSCVVIDILGRNFRISLLFFIKKNTFLF